MKLLLALLAMTGFTYAKTQEDVIKACLKVYKGDCGLIASIAYIESRYNPQAYNPEGSYGVMQVKCSTARMMGFTGRCEELYNMELNIEIAGRYIDYQITRFNRLSDVVAAYNSGTPIICKKYNEGKCWPGQYYNQAYVSKVMRVYTYLTLTTGAKYMLASIR